MSINPPTSKKALFVKEYLVDLNGAQAAIRAGYSKKAAKEQASRLLADVNIKTAIQLEMDKRAKKTEITAEMVLREIAKIAFFDPRKLFDEHGRPIPISALDDDTVAVIAGIDVVSIGNQNVGHGQVTKIKLADKSKCLELLGRHLKLFTEKVEHSGSNGSPIELVAMTREQRLTRIRELSKKLMLND